MAVTAESFRAHFPEFADPTKFADSTIAYWLTIAGLLLNTQRWTTLLEIGTELFLAHQMVLEAQAVAAANKGGMPGVQIGVLNSKSVDKVSAGYEVSASLDPSAGHWNMTTYGMRFLQLSRLIGMGPVQVGVGCPPGPLSSANAWPGPWVYNFPNMNQ